MKCPVCEQGTSPKFRIFPERVARALNDRSFQLGRSLLVIAVDRRANAVACALQISSAHSMLTCMQDITHLLEQIEQGDQAASEQLLPLVYEDLRRLAAAKMSKEKPGQTLQPTALVHEAYLRLVNAKELQKWNSRSHFFAAAAEAMRRILINRVRDKNRIKRGGKLHRVDLDKVELADQTPDDVLLAVNEALEDLARENPAAADLVKLRYFAGFTLKDAATSLNISTSTADRRWAFARAWLVDALSANDMDDADK